MSVIACLQQSSTAIRRSSKENAPKHRALHPVISRLRKSRALLVEAYCTTQFAPDDVTQHSSLLLQRVLGLQHDFHIALLV